MKIKEIISQNRRDFTAIYECEHCGHTERGSGYDDTYFHEKVIPQKTCSNCGKKSPDNYRALKPKYSDDVQI